MLCATYAFVHTPNLREVDEPVSYILLVLVHVSEILHVQGYGNDTHHIVLQVYTFLG